MFLEYDWSFGVYRPRFGQAFTDFRGHRSFDTLVEAQHVIESAGCKLGRKTDSRTWEIVSEGTRQ